MVVRRPVAVALLSAALAAISGLARSESGPPPSEPAILVSRQLLAAQQLHVGDVVALSADPDGSQPRAFRIAGEYEPTPDPMRLGAVRHEVRLHLPDLIDLQSNASNQ